MATLFQRLRAKQKQDEERRAARAEKRAAKKRERIVAHVAKQSKDAAYGLLDLPLEVAVAIEENVERTPVQPAPAQHDESSVENLVTRLTAIRERLFWLQAVWATSLSPDVAMEADRYRQVFQELGARLKEKDADAYERLVAGHEALLLAEPMPTKQTLPLAMQRWFELAGELQSRPTPRTQPKPAGYVPDGLQSLL